MKWKDSEEDAGPRTEGGDIDFDGDKFSLKKDNEANDLRPNLFKKNRMSFVMVGAGVVVLIILLLFFFSGPHKTVGIGQLKTLESTVKQLEARIANLEGNRKQIAALSRQLKTLTQVKKQVGLLETSVAMQLNVMARELESLKKMPAGAQPKKMPAEQTSPVPTDDQQSRYHEVRRGENLYRIGLRYGLKVNELLRLNNMEPGAVIQPGQKLRVKQ